MTTALAIWIPPTLVRRRSLVLESVVNFATDSPALRFHFAFLAALKRSMIEKGGSPPLVETAMHNGHVEWWGRCSRRTLGTHVAMHEATLDETAAIVVPFAQSIDLDSQAWRWYPDGWHPLVAWAAAGGRGDVSSIGMRVASSGATAAERTRHMTPEERADAIGPPPQRPALRVVQDGGPLFDGELPPLSLDMEAEYDDEPVDAEWTER